MDWGSVNQHQDTKRSNTSIGPTGICQASGGLSSSRSCVARLHTQRSTTQTTYIKRPWRTKIQYLFSIESIFAWFRPLGRGSSQSCDARKLHLTGTAQLVLSVAQVEQRSRAPIMTAIVADNCCLNLLRVRP